MTKIKREIGSEEIKERESRKEMRMGRCVFPQETDNRFELVQQGAGRQKGNGENSESEEGKRHRSSVSRRRQSGRKRENRKQTGCVPILSSSFSLTLATFHCIPLSIIIFISAKCLSTQISRIFQILQPDRSRKTMQEAMTNHE